MMANNQQDVGVRHNHNQSPSVRPSLFMSKVHFFEPLGRGGLFQHTLELARLLAENGFEVTLHTASDPELSIQNMELCRCVEWHRSSKPVIRKFLITLSFIFHTVPHLSRLGARNMWFHGQFHFPLTLLAARSVRKSAVNLVFSPHNVFARGSEKLFAPGFLTTSQQFSEVVVYNTHDQELLKKLGLPVHLLPLVQLLDEAGTTKTQLAHRVSGLQRPRVGLLGQIRSDKNLGFGVDIVRKTGASLILAGQDVGGFDDLKTHLESMPSERLVVEIGYLEYSDFIHIMKNIDLLLLPYKVASQSGVASLAKKLGVPVLASNVAGLTEQADISLPVDAPTEDWISAASTLIKLDKTQIGSSDYSTTKIIDFANQIFRREVER